eukprot:98857-Rhodomonas_salina.1
MQALTVATLHCALEVSSSPASHPARSPAPTPPPPPHNGARWQEYAVDLFTNVKVFQSHQHYVTCVASTSLTMPTPSHP